MLERPTIAIQAPAKLNLALTVGAIDPPTGLHPICSWMVTVDLFDDMLLTRLAADRLSRYAVLWHEQARRRREIDWPISTDLAVLAHLALEEHVGRRLPLQLMNEKRIPVAGGLGGGSSNAAAMLRAVNELHELGLDLDELAAIGAQLGSDVPFLVRGGSAVVEGFGQKLTAHEAAPAFFAVLVFPDCPCSTRAVYEAFDAAGASDFRPDAVKRLAGDGRTSPDPAALFNDLTPAALHLAPVVGSALDRVAELAERPAHLSGSGSTLFVICDDAVHADALATAIDERLALPALPAAAHEIVHATAP